MWMLAKYFLYTLNYVLLDLCIGKEPEVLIGVT
jgi:hypothetical protein